MRHMYTAVAVLFALTAQAQNDSARTTYSQEPFKNDTSAQRSGSRFVKAYQKFIRAQVEEKTLIKIGAMPTGIIGSASDKVGWGFRSEVAVERKLIPALSVLLSARTNYWHLAPSAEQVNISSLIAGRWYHNMDKRMRLGKSADNFSDQYFTLQVNLPVWSRVRIEDPVNVLPTNVSSSWIGLAYGTQRRLGKLAYLDFNYGVGYPFDRPKSVLLTFSLLVGLGL